MSESAPRASLAIPVAVGQYFAYLIAGCLHYLLLAAFFTVAAGYSVWAFVLLVLAVVLGGFAPGLSLLAPKTGAIVGGGIALLFLVYSGMLFLGGTLGAVGAWIVASAAVAVLVSAMPFALPRGRSRRRSIAMTLSVAVAAGVPALLAVWILAHFARMFLF